MSKTNIKSELKSALKNVNLTTATIKDIQNAIKQNSPQVYSEVMNKITDIEKILKNRNLHERLTYDNCYVLALNRNANSWKTLSQDVTIKSKNGKPLKASLTSIPASEMGIFANLKRGEGISSGDSSLEHASNLWKTEAKTAGKDGKVLFSAIRHRNTRGTETATKEIILAAAVEQYGAKKLQESPKDKVWEVKIGNIQLMSPLKKPLDKILYSSDRNKSNEQIQAFENFFDKVIEVPILDTMGKEKTVKLKLKNSSFLFNFGTNSIHYDYGGILVQSSYNQNKKSFEKLFGTEILKSLEESFNFYNKHSKIKSEEKNYILKRQFVDRIDKSSGEVGKYLSQLKKEKEIHPENAKEIELKITKIINLSSQILDLWFSTHGRGIKSNPAAIQTRLAALIYLIGYPITFNCKSGKDRTGEVAAEINDLVMTMEANGGEAPDPYKKITDEEKTQASQVYDATQSDEIAKANTGFRGLKVDYKNTTNRMGKIKGSSKLSSISSKN